MTLTETDTAKDLVANSNNMEGVLTAAASDDPLPFDSRETLSTTASSSSSSSSSTVKNSEDISDTVVVTNDDGTVVAIDDDKNEKIVADSIGAIEATDAAIATPIAKNTTAVVVSNVVEDETTKNCREIIHDHDDNDDEDDNCGENDDGKEDDDNDGVGDDDDDDDDDDNGGLNDEDRKSKTSNFPRVVLRPNKKRMLKNASTETRSYVVNSSTNASSLVASKKISINAGVASSLSSSPSSALKRKANGVQMPSIDLLTFVRMIEDIARKSTMIDIVREGGKSRVEVKLPNIASFVDQHESYKDSFSTATNDTEDSEEERLSSPASSSARGGKKMKRDVNEISTLATTNERKYNFERTKTSRRQRIYLKVVNCLFAEIEARKFTLLFQREYLKYFLASYSLPVGIDDFINTNRVQKTTKKQKPVSRLTHGMILSEYIKSPDLFASNLSRCPPEDAQALRFVVENKIELSKSIYECMQTRAPEFRYVIEEKNQTRDGFIKLPVKNFKRVVVAVTKSVIVTVDGISHSVQSSPALERDISTECMNTLPFEKLYIDLLICNSQHKIIDIYTDPQGILTPVRANANVAPVLKTLLVAEDGNRLPIEYCKRMRVASLLFPQLKPLESMDAASTSSSASIEGSYIQKMKKGYNEINYVYHKPLHTVAIIGISGSQSKQACLAYKSPVDDSTLIYKLKANISGPISAIIYTAPLQQKKDAENDSSSSSSLLTQPSILSSTIEDKGKIMKIVGLGSSSSSSSSSSSQPLPLSSLSSDAATSSSDIGDVQLLQKVIRVELRDGNKLAALSDNDVTSATEFKATSSTKDNASLENLLNIFNDPANMGCIMAALTKSTQFEAYLKQLSLDHNSCNINFEN